MSNRVVQEYSMQNVICLSSAQIESHDANVEEYTEAVMTTVVSSIPNIQRFSSMLGTSSFHHLSSIMGATIRNSTISFDSPINSSPSFFSPPQSITTSLVPYIF